MKMLLGDFSVKVGGEDDFKQTIGNESLHEISNDNGVIVVNVATCKTQVKSIMFLHKYTWGISRCETDSQIDHILMYRQRHSSRLDV
jgi:hypothetical protein